MCPENAPRPVKLPSNTGSAFVSVCVPGAGLWSGQHVFCEKSLRGLHAKSTLQITWLGLKVIRRVSVLCPQACLPAAASDSEHVGPTERGHLLSLLSMGWERGPGHLLHSGGCSGTQVVGHTPCHPIRTLVQLTSPVLTGGRDRVDLRDCPSSAPSHTCMLGCTCSCDKCVCV